MHLIRKGPAPRFAPNFSDEEKETLDRILDLTSRLTDNEVKALAYSAAQMRFIADMERREGRTLINTPIDFHYMTEPGALKRA